MKQFISSTELFIWSVSYHLLPSSTDLTTVITRCITHLYRLHHLPASLSASLTIITVCTTHHHYCLHRSTSLLSALLTIITCCTTHHHHLLHHSPSSLSAPLTIITVCITHRHQLLLHPPSSPIASPTIIWITHRNVSPAVIICYITRLHHLLYHFASLQLEVFIVHLHFMSSSPRAED